MVERDPSLVRRGGPSVTAQTWLAARLPFFYGWVMVGVGSIGLLCSGPGQSAVIAAFMEPMIGDLGLSTSAVASAFLVGNLLAALAMGPVGRLTDHYGGRVVLAAGSFILGATCLLMARVEGLIGVLLGFAMLRLLVQGTLTLAGTTLVAQWFVRRRGRAQSLMAMGMTASFAVYPPLAQFLIDALSWRLAWVALGFISWLVLLPPILLLVRSRPEEMGLRPDGEATALAAPGATETAAPEEVAWTSGQATRTPTFWLISGAIAVTWLVGAGLNFHQVALFTRYGLSAQFAAAIFTVAAIVSVPTTFMAGQLVDRLPARRLLVVMLLIQAVAVWWLLWATTPLLAVVYGALNGVMIGLSGVVNAVIFAAYYGRRHLGSIRGITMIANVAASALGPLPLGLARDLLGAYDAALIGLGLLPVLGALALRWVVPPGPPPGEKVA